MTEVFRGIKARDWALAGALTALGVLMMAFVIGTTDTQVARAIAEGSMVHPVESRSPWLVPVFVAATMPVLWWRRGVLAVTGVAVAALALHDVLFGWVTRCGAGIPLGLTLAFLGALAYQRGRAWLVGGLSGLLLFLVAVRDATTGLGALWVALPVLLLVFGLGRAARHRTGLHRELEIQEAELRRLRDERAALLVAGDRARLSRRLDGLLQERLDQLTGAADTAVELAPAEARARLAAIESSSRQTLDDMREIVGLLRGGDVALAPTPTVAHLDALLARHRTAKSRLTVTGDPRSLPATVELSAYRIVEHLVAALADLADTPVAVAIRFGEDALEIRVDGRLEKGADVKAAVARARERARLLGGTLEVKVARGRARAVAQLPVLA